MVNIPIILGNPRGGQKGLTDEGANRPFSWFRERSVGSVGSAEGVLDG